MLSTIYFDNPFLSPPNEEKKLFLNKKPFAEGSEWILDGFESNGKKDKRPGKFVINPLGQSYIEIHPFGIWKIQASRVNGNATKGIIDLDIQTEGEFSGEYTLYGIYVVENGYLKCCFCSDEANRPNKFVTKEKDGRSLLFLKKRK